MLIYKVLKRFSVLSFVKWLLSTSFIKINISQSSFVFKIPELSSDTTNRLVTIEIEFPLNNIATSLVRNAEKQIDVGFRPVTY